MLEKIIGAIRMQKDSKTKSSKLGITPKQKVVYDTIRDYIRQNGFSPSYEEIKQLVGLNSKENVHRYVHQLAARKWIGFGNGRNRSIFIL